ncbi:gamma-glutamylcyclotransferase family protein [Xanthocytophaga flava]|uniref:gamma-glutamylcyclotransferase family protein n=1 Tax=Xanthocytophaga flava TaxID=3048013 RepID=UPI0028D3950B|nr:gamma-glutamylcyclotransferase family protein [Xanthocytophaga flavus]MDJ1470926.1 gamma-glutamylcyclotransferase family protein [Xanthocytophaga flavus]
MLQNLYFSYGSNISLEKMQKLCPNAKLLGAGYLESYQLVFTTHLEQRSRGGADVVPAAGEEVWGLLYKINDIELAVMDANKFYPEIYDRISVTIQLREGAGYKTVENVWTYVMQDKQKSYAQPTIDYVNLLLDAAKANEFPFSYQEYLISFQNKIG